MELPQARSGPYVRALRAAVDALAPDEDHVPLRRALTHLEAIDPATSGDLLAPAEITTSGMPAYTWLERARAEQILARRSDPARDPQDAEIRRASSLDPALGARMRDRRALHRLLRHQELLSATEVTVATRAFGADGGRLAVHYDRMAPDGRWLRLRLELDAPARPRSFTIDAAGRASADESLRHLLTRHFAVPLPALVRQVADATGCRVARCGRGWIGPFWFPGIALPEEVPPELGAGLLLNLAVEVVADDIEHPRTLDPLHPFLPADAPDGLSWFLSRRFAATGVA
ncbi:MAG: hypothetical protein KC621_32115, partial [Myxococcales bacterium]|nr:hypothetical protein [Myxococcales bacterium]